MRWIIAGAALSFLPLLSLALPGQKLDNRAYNGPLYNYGNPSQDTFYTNNPSNLATYAPGAIIRRRQLPNNLTSLLPANIVANISQTWQVFYRTSDIFGAPAAAVATIWVPLNGSPNKLLSYQPPWDSPNLDCASSYDLQNGYLFTRAAEAKLPANLIPISALNQGWYMVLPDHEGIIAALGSGVTSGYATLDGIRAALNSASFTGVSPSAKIVLSGYSGGAPPTEFAAELKSQYAPELNIVGAVSGGINPNSLYQLNLAKLPDLQFQNILGQFVGLAKAYPNLTTWINNNLNQAVSTKFYQQLHTCVPTTTLNSLNLFFKNPFQGVGSPIPQSVWYWGTTWGLRGTPTFPLYINQGLKGPLASSYPDNFVSSMCSKGVKVTYARNANTNHNSESVIGNAGELLWIADRFNGVPVPTTCTTLHLSTTTLATSQQTLYGAPIYSSLVSAAKSLQNGAIIG